MNIFYLIASFLLFFYVPAWSQTLNALDTNFLIRAQQFALFQIDAGDLANRKGSSTLVKDAARLITAEQKVLITPILSAATQFNVILPSQSNEDQMLLLNQLENATCLQFDSLFVNTLRLENGKMFSAIGLVRGSTQNQVVRTVAEMANDAALRHMKSLEATGLVNWNLIPLPSLPAGRVENIVNTSLGVLTEGDRDLLVRVRLAGLWEIPAGDWAVQKGVNAFVRQNGQKISDEHKVLDAAVVAVAAQFGVPLPNEPNAEQNGWLAEMQAATGAQFDQIFVDRLRFAHGAIFPAISDVRAGTRNSAIRQFAEVGNTVVTRHQTYLEETTLTNANSFPVFTLAPTPASVTSISTTIPNPAEADLLIRVRLAGLWEIPAGDMAERKSLSAKVREIGKKISLEHKILDSQVTNAASQLGVALPNEPNAEQKGWIAQMEAATGSQFDQLFVDLLRAAHGSIFTIIGNIRASTRNPMMRAFAEVGNTAVLRHQTYLESTGLVDWSKLPLPPSPVGVTTAPQNTDFGILTAGDRDLLVRVRLACLWEIPAGDWTEQRAFSAIVKDIGQRISAEHQILDIATVGTARLLGVEVPNQPNAEQNGWLAEMQAARTPREFDQIFIDRLRVAHGVIYPIISAVRAGTRNSVMRTYAEVANAAVTRHMTYLESANIFNFNLINQPALPPAPPTPRPSANTPSSAPTSRPSGTTSTTGTSTSGTIPPIDPEIDPPGVCACTESKSSVVIYVIAAIVITTLITGIIAFFYSKKIQKESESKGSVGNGGTNLFNPIAMNNSYYASSPPASSTSTPRNNFVV